MAKISNKTHISRLNSRSSYFIQSYPVKSTTTIIFFSDHITL